MRGVLVGCGFFAQFQMEAWRRLAPRVFITAVCDLDLNRAQAFADRHGVARAYGDFGAMLDAERPDFVDIVTRPESHLPLVRQAAERGVAILCQKPLAPDLEVGREIVAAAQRVPFMVNENWRWQAWYRKIQRLLTQGILGEPFGYRWVHRAKDGWLPTPYPNQPYFAHYPRFLIYETLVHYLDCGRYLFGEPEQLQCQTGRVNPAIAGEDLALILLRHRGAVYGAVDGNRCSPPDEPGDVMGSLRIDATGGSPWLAGDGRITIEQRASGIREPHPWAIPKLGYRGDSCYLAQRHFLECLETGAAFESTGPDYLRTLELVEACYESAASGRCVELVR